MERSFYSLFRNFIKKTTFDFLREIGVISSIWGAVVTLVWNVLIGSCHFFYVKCLIIIIICSLTARVVGAPRWFRNQFSSFSPGLHCHLGPAELQAWCLPTSSSVCLVFFPLSLCLARRFWPDLMNGRHDHTTAVCVSLTVLKKNVIKWLVRRAIER